MAPSRPGLALGDRHRALRELEALIAEAERRCAEHRARVGLRTLEGGDGRRSAATLRLVEDRLAWLRASREVLTDDGGRSRRPRAGRPATGDRATPRLTPGQCRAARGLLG